MSTGWITRTVPMVVLSAALLAALTLFSRETSSTESAAYSPADPTEYAPQKGRRTPGLDLVAILQPDAEQLKRGRELYTATCAPCHGPEGRGDGPAGLTLGARNFAAPGGWKSGMKLTDIFRTLSTGLAPSMPAYDYMPAGDRFALAHYVQSLGDFEHGAAGRTEIALLDEEFSLSAGTREPNRIPVGAAMDCVLRDARPAVIDVDELPAESPAGRLLKRVMHDESRAAAALQSIEGWRTDRVRFARALCAGVPHNGFGSAVARLNAREWKLLHGIMVRLSDR